MSTEPSFAQRDRRAIRGKEREALVLLHEAGWSAGELAMTFGASEKTIWRTLQFEGALR